MMSGRQETSEILRKDNYESCGALSIILYGMLEFLMVFGDNQITLPIVIVNTLPSLCHCVPLICLQHMALYKCVFDLN